MDTLSKELQQPKLHAMIRRFLFDQVYADEQMSSADVPINLCPIFDGRVAVYHSATATFYAPSELAGSGGMHREIIHSTPSWYHEYERRDTILIQNGLDKDVMGGMLVGWVIRFLSIVHDNLQYLFAYVEWFEPFADACDPLTGLWVVRPEKEGRHRAVGLVHVDSIVRACHLIGVFGSARIPLDFHFADSLDAFKMFYVNQYADYHSHECLP